MNEVPKEVPLCCQCGHLRGTANDVAPHTGFRFVCYCRDCQAFARFLKRPDVLDPAGGTDIFHMPAGRVKFIAGTDALRCLHFSERVFRWYTTCCRTPVANTAGPGFPVVGIVHSFMSCDAVGHSREEVLGAPLCTIFEGSATAPLPPTAPPRRSFGLVARRLPTLLGWWWRGLGRPNPFFDAATGAPLATPRVFTASERAALDRDTRH